MRFDFATILVGLTALTGGIWLLDRILFAGRRRSDQKEPLAVDYARSFFPVILIVLLIRSFLAEPFRIPSGSMEPTLLVGDLILVNKFAYGLRWPVLNKKFIDLGGPKRGDVVVFRFPKDPSLDYIKRVIGLPGDIIEYRSKQLTINGEPVPAEWLSDDNLPLRRGLQQATERLPGKEHAIQIDQTRGRRAYPNNPWTVEEGNYFVLGDNRDHSEDSRFWGFVPDDHLVGKAFLIWMQLSPSQWNRIGTVIE